MEATPTDTIIIARLEQLEQAEKAVMEKFAVQQVQPLPTGQQLVVSQHTRVQTQPGAYPEGGSRSLFGASFLATDPASVVGNAEEITSSTADSTLVQARRVDEEVADTLPQAEPIAPIPKDLITCNQPNCMFICATVIIMIILVVVVIFSVGYDSGEQEEMTSSANPSRVHPNQSLVFEEGYLMKLLPERTRHSVSLSSSTCQAAAFQWLLEDPSLQSYPPLRVQQRFALAAIFHATTGNQWTEAEGWLDYNLHECDWYVSDSFYFYARPLEVQTSPCDPQVDNKNTERIFKRLWISENNLEGTLPEEVFTLLTNLESIHLYNNTGLHGTVSSSIAQLSNLKFLSLVMTGFSGTLPSELGLLSLLEIAYFEKVPDKSAPTFEGSLPTELGLLTSLEQLTLGHSSLTGSLPTEVGKLTNINFLMFQNNHIVGPIPSELGSTQLEFFYAYDNHLSGVIPSELGLLNGLRTLHLYNNYHLEGTIPTSFGNLTVLKELMLSQNNLSGPIPIRTLGELENLRMLYLSHNPRLSGSLPVHDLFMTNWSQMEAIDVFNGTSISLVARSVEYNASEILQGEQRLQDAMNTSFWRYYYECNRRFPCPINYGLNHG